MVAFEHQRFSVETTGPRSPPGKRSLNKSRVGVRVSRSLALFLSMALPTSVVSAAEPPDVQFGSVPAWALPPPSPSGELREVDAPFRVIYQDTQIHAAGNRQEIYSAYRFKILKPEALGLGAIKLTWLPTAGTATVHYFRIIRGDQSIDVLKVAKFKVIEREANLERSMLDGELTAQIEVPGLQVGDELEFAGTIVRREPAFGDHVSNLTQLPVVGSPGTFRFRLLWPQTKPLLWRATKDLPQVTPTVRNGEKVVIMELRRPPSAIPTDGAPPRFNFRRVIEFSDFSSWAELSNKVWPLFENASRLSADSPIRREAAKIAASSADPIERTQAALRLVQDQIRYVYVGLDGGNYRPASADETWQRRFGDCKAKTVLLLALLRELGIEAEAVMVNSKGGDGTNERLPNPALFDHVLVRAHVKGSTFWLDGTRLGDRYLDMLPPPPFAWGLPLSASGDKLVAVPPVPSKFPQFIGVIDIDASGGFTKNAVVKAQNVFHSDEGVQIRTQLAGLSREDADRALKAYWRHELDWVESKQVAWRYDERHAALIMNLTGEGKVDWDGDDQEGHSFSMPGGGFYAPEQFRRPGEQDQTAAWAVEFPRFRCWATTVRLPKPQDKWRWSYRSKPVNRRLGGIEYWRAAGMQGDVVRTVMSRQSLVSEISAAEAAKVNAQIPGFDRNMSTVFEAVAPDPTLSHVMPFSDDVDWASNPAPCSPNAIGTEAQEAPTLTKASQAVAGYGSKFLPSLETLALPSERPVMNDLLSSMARAGADPKALLDASDAALSRLPAPTRLRAFVQLNRASALSALHREMDALEPVQEGIRLLPGYSAPLILAMNVYAYLDRPGEAADYLVRAIDIDPQTVRTMPDYDVGNILTRLNTARDERRVQALSDRLLAIGWLGKQLGSQSRLAVEAIKRHVAQGDLAGARALIPKLLLPAHSFSLLMQNEYRPLWPDVETWSGPRLERQWATYLTEAQARWTAGKSAEAGKDYLTALAAAGHYKTAVRELLPLFDKPDRLQDYDLIFMVNSLAEALARVGRSQDGDALFDRAQAVWPIEEQANALNIAANHAHFLLVEGKPEAALKLMDESIAQTRKWGSEVNSSAVTAMHHYRACILHELGRDAEAGVSEAITVANQGPALIALMHICLGDVEAAKKALIAGLQFESSRESIIQMVQLPTRDPLPSAYAKKMEARLAAIRNDAEILKAIAKYGRVVPWAEDSAAPPEAP